MSPTHDDPRVTAYVFGELPSEQVAEFDCELEASPELQQEVAGVRDAIAAIENEFTSRSTSMSADQLRVVENAIEQQAKNGNGVVTPVALDADRGPSSRAAIIAVLAASVVLAIGLTFPYWASQSGREISMNESAPHAAGRAAEAKTFPDGTLLAEDESAGMKMDGDDETTDAPASEAPSATIASDGSGAAVGRPERQDASTKIVEEFSIAASGVEGLGAEELGAEEMGYKAQPISDLQRSSQRASIQATASAQVLDDEPSQSSAADPSHRQRQLAGEARASDIGAKTNLFGGAADARGADQYAGDGLGGIPAPTPGRAQRSRRRGGMSEMEMGMDGVTAAIELGMMSEAPQPAAPAGAAESIQRDSNIALSVTASRPTSDRIARRSGSKGDKEFERLDRITSFGTASLSKQQIGGGQQADAADSSRALGESDDFAAALDPAGDRFATIHDNPFFEVGQAPLSTFSIDVDTASYGKIRSLLRNNSLPRPSAVRIEELLNYFDYDYPGPQGEHPFAASMEIAQCPWNSKHRLARIGIQAKQIETQRPASNLVFLLDVSGSMNRAEKLPLMIEGMKLLTDQLTENDQVAIVVYAGAAGLVLDSTNGDRKEQIISSLDRLRAGGSTNGGQGIRLAYDVARDNFVDGGVNRVILCSDGDFNVGVTGTDELVQIAKENARSNIFLSVLGFGIGNHNDEMMEKVSNDANGNYAFIDNKSEAEKVLVDEIGGTLVTVAKDVKIQIEFNPAKVSAYRLIGYENRILKAQDFADDTKDAGEIGAGHTVTALYEIVPADNESETSSSLEELRYQTPGGLTEKAKSNETLILKLRYKQPEGDTSSLIEFPVADDGKSFIQSDRDFQFAAAVAGFGMLLRDSPHKGGLSFADVDAIATESAKGDDFGYRSEFLELVKKAWQLAGQR